MKAISNDILNTYIIIHWWNMGKKTLGFEGTLRQYLSEKEITYRRKRTDIDGVYQYSFLYRVGGAGIKHVSNGTEQDFIRIAKNVIMYGMVYLGDKSELYVQNYGTYSINK